MDEIRSRVRRALFEGGSIEELAAWFSQNGKALFRSADEKTQKLIFEIDVLYAEFTLGIVSPEELRNDLIELLKTV